MELTILANPIVINPVPPVVLAGLLEACIAALILARRGYPAARMLALWAFLSLLTFIGLVIPWVVHVADDGLLLHAIEIPIVIVEGILIFWQLGLLRHRLSPSPASVKLATCLVISLVANAVSYLASLVAFPI
jgi:hypothetical protein